ncbi:retrovirus-related pol polyprotein from transposon TNT 1-94 [Tanacetum coccineum]
MLMARTSTADGNMDIAYMMNRLFIIFDDLHVDNNGGTSKHDSIAHEEYHEMQMLTYNVQREAENQKHIVDLEEKLSSHDRIVYKMGQSLQTIHMLGKKPNKVYDPFLKAGLGYQNPERLKKAIAAQPKMYDGDMLHSDKLIIDSPDSEETLEDADEKFSAEQTYFSIPSTSNNSSESKDVPSESPVLKMPKESRLLKMVDTMGDAITGLHTRFNKTLLQDTERRWLSDSQNKLREFYKTDVIPMSRSLYKNLKEIKEELIEEVQEIQVESVVQERENIKLEFQKLFISIKLTRAQHQKEVDELIKCVNQKTYAYGDVRAKNQDLLMTISELKSKLRTIEKGKNVNTKFDSSETLGNRICVTPFNKNIVDKAMNASNTKVNSDRSKPVTSQSTPKPEQGQKHNENVITRGMYKINKQDTNTPDSKANTNVSDSTGVGSSHSVRRSTSKDNKSKNSILKNTSTYVWKTLNSDCLDSNKCETKTSNVCQTNACISNSKTVKSCVNVVNDGSNIVCISCGNDVFLNSHKKCVARHALSRKSSVKRALFTSPLAAQSKNLGATSIVIKSRLSVAKTPIATHKVIQLVLWIVDSGCSKHMTGNLQLLRNFVEKFMGTVRFGNDHFAAITGYIDYVQGNLTICHVYYVEGLGQNMLVGQFCDGDLESHINKILVMAPSSITFEFWHHQLTSNDLVDGLPKFKYNKDHLCSACEQEAARTMLIFSKAPEFLWAEAIATACFTQNRSIVHTRHNKTPYELICGRKPNIQYFHVFGSLCYPTNDRDDLGKMKPKADIGIFIGYSESS